MKNAMNRIVGTVLSSASLALVLSGSSLPAAPKVATAYTISNDPAGNAVLVFNFDGASLSAGPVVPTGGLGTGGQEPDFALGNAHVLQISDDGKLLFVCNPGSDTISVFATTATGLTPVDTVSSGGSLPVSLAVKKGLLYVINAGGNVEGGKDNIVGFTISSDGHLTQLSGSARPLSRDTTLPGQIGFSPDGNVLVVSEKFPTDSPGRMSTFTVGADGYATGPRVTPSDAIFPFGFAFANRNQLFVADNFYDATGAGALSSWIVGGDGSLTLVSSIVPTLQTGTCWAETTKDGRYVLTSNTGASTLSVFSIDKQSAQVKLVNAFPASSGPTDFNFSHDGRYLFAVCPDEFNAGSPSIDVWSFNQNDGTAVKLQGVSGLPLSIDGLVAY
jgi:6-phosphogluconolactonase (cycloisomerase 2 family)